MFEGPHGVQVKSVCPEDYSQDNGVSVFLELPSDCTIQPKQGWRIGFVTTSERSGLPHSRGKPYCDKGPPLDYLKTRSRRRLHLHSMRRACRNPVRFAVSHFLRTSALTLLAAARG